MTREERVWGGQRFVHGRGRLKFKVFKSHDLAVVVVFISSIHVRCGTFFLWLLALAGWRSIVVQIERADGVLDSNPCPSLILPLAAIPCAICAPRLRVQRASLEFDSSVASLLVSVEEAACAWQPVAGVVAARLAAVFGAAVDVEFGAGPGADLHVGVVACAVGAGSLRQWSV